MRSNIVRTPSGASVPDSMPASGSPRSVNGASVLGAFGGLEEDGEVAEVLRIAADSGLPSAANDGIGDPGDLLDGLIRWSICHWMPRFFNPSLGQVGRAEVAYCPFPAYV